MKRLKLQSAMEYLMTYGWAILIIAVVLGALYALGVFNGGTLPTSCIAQSGFLCQSPVYSHGTGNIVITFGEQLGTWATANVAFANQTVSGTISSTGSFPAAITGPAAYNAISGGLASGQTVGISLPVSATSTKLGTTVQGTVWVQYQTAANGAFSYAQVGTLTAKAT